MATVTVSDGTKINYYLDDFTDPWLESDTIVIMYGCGGTARIPYRLVPGLARKYKVLRIDERGTGESGMPPGGYKPSTERFAEDLLNVIDQLGMQKIHLFGYHSGGWVGAMFAISYPDRTKTLILCNSPYRGPGDKRDIVDRYSQGEGDVAISIRKLGFREWAKRGGQSLAMEKNVTPEMKEWCDKERGKNPTEVEAARYGWAFSYDWRDDLKKMKMPTLILVGGKARYCPPEMACEMQKMIPNAQLAIMPNAGDNISFAHSDRCVEYILGFHQNLEG